MIVKRQLLQSIYSWNEQDRRQLAQELHDTVLQDQIVWYREIVKLLELELLPFIVARKLDEIAEGMIVLIDELRHYCQETRPPFVMNAGLSKAVEQLIHKFHLRSNIEVLSLIDIEDQQQDEQFALHLYRIIQELLSNANKHSMAKHIMLELYERNRMLHIDYYDDGIGMKDVTKIEQLDTMGISGIHYRVASLGGKITFESVINQGLSVQVAIPM